MEEDSKIQSPSIIEISRHSADLMDEQRHEKVAYEYLCRLEETKQWIEACIGETLPETTLLEEHLRNGVYLAKLAHTFAPAVVPLKKIYDVDQAIYRESGLKFRHTDNIHQWLEFMHRLKFPKIFMPETTDLFDKKNLPRVVYCIHALSLHLFHLGMAPQMEDLNGTAIFTADDIQEMSRQLKNYKFPLPQFGKIGGILANELPLDETENHQAIAAINEALVLQNSDAFAEALSVPAARLQNVHQSLSLIYYGALTEALHKKHGEETNNLSKAEIQNNINLVNEFAALDELAMAVEKRDPEEMLRCLRKAELKLRDVRDENTLNYLEALAQIIEDSNYSSDDVREVIEDVNNRTNLIDFYVKEINQSLNETSVETLQALRELGRRAPSTKLKILDFAAPLYLEEMRKFRELTGEDLDCDTICGAVATLNKIAMVTEAVDRKNLNRLMVCLQEPELNFEDIDASLAQDYLEALITARQLKLQDKTSCDLLTHLDIQSCIDEVKSQKIENQDVLESLNQSVAAGNMDSLVSSLLTLPLDGISSEMGPVYLRLLKALLETKKRVPKVDHKLSIEDVHEVLKKSDEFSKEAFHWCRLLSVLHMTKNQSERRGALRSLLNGLKATTDQENAVLHHISAYLQKHNVQALPAEECWVYTRLEQGVPVYLDLKTKSVSWTQSKEDRRSNPVFLSVSQIRTMFAEISAAEERKEVESFVVRIQSWWRGIVQRRRYLRALEEKKRKATSSGGNLFFYAQHISKIILIQAAWRRWRAMKAFRTITEGTSVSLATLRRFLHLLDIGQRDFKEELEVQQLKAEVVQSIRRNKKLEKDLKAMDVKIGLLVRNQVALQDVVAHGHKLRKQMKQHSGSGDARPNIELLSMTKQGQQKLEAYQHLFYLLQTEPRYLAKLLFIQPQDLSPTIMSLYNYGSNVREEYLLLKLFKLALEEEIRCKVESVNDITTGTPVVITMALNANRQGHSLVVLREMLSPLVNKILRDTNLSISTNPIEAYKHWINQMETSTGQPCGLPYNVSQSEALKHAAVRKTINDSIEYLKKATLAFLQHITSDVNKIPYSMLYLAKVLSRALRTKFPAMPEKEILKVVGNLIYYRYINTAIVAPDAFDIITVSSTDVITTEQRKNLGQIAKLLQFAASKKGFGEENSHLMCLNSFLIECHEQFKAFFKKCIQVDEPEIRFGMDQYSEATLVAKPVVHLTLQEMTDVHKLLVEYEMLLASSPEDPLHQLLDDFGPGPQRNQPSLNHLLAAAENKENVGTFSMLNEVAKTEIALMLNNKYEDSVTSSPGSEKNQKLLVNTKQMLVNILRCSKGETVKEVLIKPVDEEEQSLYTQLLRQQKRCGDQNLDISQRLNQTVSNSEDVEPSLYNLKMKVVRNLRTLEKNGFISLENNYNDLKTSLAQDLINMRMHRRARARELSSLRETKLLLEEKAKFHEEQANYYHQYLETCLKNLTLGKSQKKLQHQKQPTSTTAQVSTLKLKSPLKYSGAKLHQKGILLDIDGLNQSHLKSIFFNVNPTSENGVFEITAKFMGTEIEKVQLNIQDLLQMQYEGVTVLNLFNKARINVNLFLYLVNVKFYGKSR